MQAHFYNAARNLPRKPYPAVAGLKNAIEVFDIPAEILQRRRIEEFIDDSFVRELDQSGYIDGLYK
jgi:hypothetical protein